MLFIIKQGQILVPNTLLCNDMVNTGSIVTIRKQFYRIIKNNFLAKHCYVVYQFGNTQLPVLG